MESLILIIIFSLATAFFATENTGNVHILLGNFMVSSIPLYIVVIGSILLGVFISWLISLVNTFSTLFMLHGKDAALQKLEKEKIQLEGKNHELEMEIAELHGEKKHVQEEDKKQISSHSFLRHGIQYG